MLNSEAEIAQVDPDVGMFDSEVDIITAPNAAEYAAGTKTRLPGEPMIGVGSDAEEDLSAFDPANFVVTAQKIAESMVPKKLRTVAIRSLT
jgi:hypothetical protein